ncbi:hypothetical protein BD324DRAFT_657052 [Kockovaella imperatae]|uniref:Six-hairpin glycosidase-like protein n=1 Tax=Kockovaella imperatae TaxID=4999 RepID=A0A1Y1UDH4_9TREE|nr:hypothetical protein BD324DRAFT_657052 [Kockovaella imperatae]ORX36108.1 hypothetical protein BD324DRAFT_657052 [Kockovaella imperatae]
MLGSISLFALLATFTSATAIPTKRWPAPSPALSLNQWDQAMFDVSMQIGDWSWEPSTGWIESDDDNGHTSSRFTSWYVPGLLHRNATGDLENAIWAIENVISVQFDNAEWIGQPWYWDYKQASDIPAPNNQTYPASIYNTYDPNWAFFIGLQFVQIVSEFEEMLPPTLVESMVNSTYKAARMLMTRVGYDGDNLVTAYSNPAIGRAIVVEWVGDRLNDANLTAAGNQYAQDIYDLFTANGYNTLGEYNVPTYYGIDVLGLCSWIRYAPSGSKLPGYGQYILQNLWADIAEHYNYNLKNMVGPYDRVYHRNMLIDDSIISLFFWLLIGRENAPVAPIGMESTTYDLREGVAFALVGQTLRDNVNASTVARLTEYPTEDREFTRYIRVSLHNDTTRVNTAWINENVMAGGQQVAEEVSRGSQFTPMIAHWKSGNTSMASRPFVSFFQQYDTTTSYNNTVTANHITVSYPNTTQSGTDMFMFLIGDIPAPFYAAGEIMHGFDNLPCLSVNITSQGLNGTVDYGDYCDFSIQSNCMYPVTYYVDPDFKGTPTMEFDLTYTC